MFNVSRNLCNFRASNNGKFALVNSSFSAVNTFTAKVNDGSSVFSATNEARTDFYAHGFRVSTVEVPDASSPYGINAEYVTDLGSVNFYEANNFMAKTPTMRDRYREVDFSRFAGNTVNDSQDGYILNMALSWLEATLSKHNDKTSYKKGFARVKTMVYSDSHGKVDMTLDDDVVQEWPLGPPVDISNVSATDYNTRTHGTYFDYGQVIKYEAKDAKQETFYLIHLLGRDKVMRNHLNIKITGVDLESIAVDNGRDGAHSFLPSLVDWSDADSMWRYICEYVEVNRLTHQLATVMEMLAFLVFQPAPTSVEANLWRYGEFVVTIPLMKFTRAVLPILISGGAFMPSAAPAEYRATMLNEPLSVLVDGAVDNVYFWAGMYTVYQQYAHSVIPWHAVFTSAEGMLACKYSPSQRAEMISVVTGHDIVTLFSDSTKVNYYPDDAHRKLHIPDYVPSRLEGLEDVSCKTVPMYNTASLVIGTLTDQVGETPHLTGLQDITLNQSKSGDDTRVGSLMIAGLYRLFGWDTTAEVGRFREVRRSWAASETCVIDPISLYANDDGEAAVRVMYAERRPGRSATLDTLEAMRSKGHVVLMISTPTISYKITGSRLREASYLMMKTPITKLPQIKVSAQSMVRTVHLQARADKTDRDKNIFKSDFREADANPPPLMASVSAPTEQIMDGSTGLDDNAHAAASI